MKVAFYVGTQKMPYGLGNVAIRIRLRSKISHCEVMFEEGDGIEEHLPDGTLAPKEGKHWCVSASTLDKMPEHSPKRAGKRGGVRLKRINVNTSKWILVDVPFVDPKAAWKKFKEIEGRMYDWQAIVGFLAFFVPNKKNRYCCHEVVAEMIGLEDPSRTDPASLYHTIKLMNKGGSKALLDHMEKEPKADTVIFDDK